MQKQATAGQEFGYISPSSLAFRSKFNVVFAPNSRIREYLWDSIVLNESPISGDILVAKPCRSKLKNAQTRG